MSFKASECVIFTHLVQNASFIILHMEFSLYYSWLAFPQVLLAADLNTAQVCNHSGLTLKSTC